MLKGVPGDFLACLRGSMASKLEEFGLNLTRAILTQKWALFIYLFIFCFIFRNHFESETVNSGKNQNSNTSPKGSGKREEGWKEVVRK